MKELRIINFKLEKGFTLVEMIVVFSILAILTSLGIAAYSQYDQKQALNNGALQVVNILQTAKSKAQSQVIPPGCAGLQGYQVDFAASGYTIDVVCNGSVITVDSDTLPRNVTITSGSSTSGTFHILTGAVTNSVGTPPGNFPYSVVVRNSISGQTRSISVSADGYVSLN